MKIGVITIHFGINYGSALQAYALTYYLSNRGHEVTLINYIPARYSEFNRNKAIIKKSGLPKGVMKIVGGLPSRVIYDAIFYGFLRQFTPLSRKINSHMKLKKQFGDYDALIAGSDQIWNSDYNEGLNGAYYLSFAGNNTKKIAYAASCGKTEYESVELIQMRKMLKKLDAISVREHNMLSLLSKLNIKDATLVLDPVLLVDNSAWENLSAYKCINEEPYLFIYLLDGDTGRTVDIACKIANLLGLKSIMISFGHVWSKDDRVDKYLIYQSPTDFINLIRGADFVVTNSFHGMALSIEFNKQFIAFKRKAYNSRLDSLSKLFGLENKLVSPTDEDENIQEYIKPILYNDINIKLNEMREISSEFLNKI